MSSKRALVMPRGGYVIIEEKRFINTEGEEPEIKSRFRMTMFAGHSMITDYCDFSSYTVALDVANQMLEDFGLDKIYYEAETPDETYYIEVE